MSGTKYFCDIKSKYKHRAKKKNILFDVSNKYFYKLLKSYCTYCGAAPDNKWKRKRDYTSPYNGIDRINNNKGYIKGNIISCCKTCNSMKSDLSLKDFYKHIRKILNTKESKDAQRRNKSL